MDQNVKSKSKIIEAMQSFNKWDQDFHIRRKINEGYIEFRAK